MEFGEGLNKLKRYTNALTPVASSAEDAEKDTNKWIREFERDASAVLEFVYNTQLEHAACKWVRAARPKSQGAMLVLSCYPWCPACQVNAHAEGSALSEGGTRKGAELVSLLPCP